MTGPNVLVVKLWVNISDDGIMMLQLSLLASNPALSILDELNALQCIPTLALRLNCRKALGVMQLV